MAVGMLPVWRHEDKAMTLTDIRADQEAFKRQCSSKRGYADEQRAIRAINIAKYERGTILRKYACPFCGKWHLTKSEKI